MRCEVKLYVAGTVFSEEVIARDYAEARQVALSQSKCQSNFSHCQTMKTEKLYELEVPELEKLIEHAEQEAERLEITCEYYIMRTIRDHL
jgi:hypothetical protein